MLRTSTDIIRQVGNTILSSKSNTKHFNLKEDEIQEWIRCRENPIYYIKKYVKFETVGGVSSYAEGNNFHPKLRRFVKAIFKHHKATLLASRQLGKALDISTPLLKPTGQWTTMGDIKEGDYLYGSNGFPTKVITTTDIMYDRPIYEIEFDNNDKIRCDENHLWLVSNCSFNIENKILTTKDIFEKTQKLKTWSQSTNFKINITPVINKHRNVLPLHPYLLGLWLGDGTSKNSDISTSLLDYPFIKKLLTDRGYQCSDLNLYSKTKKSGGFKIHSNVYKILKKMNLLNNKHIPKDYLFTSIEQRLELLRGLLDSDGYCNKKCGTVQFYQKKFELLDQVRQILSSLGIKSRIKSRIIKEQIYYTLTFTTNKYRVFNLERKAERQIGSGIREENYNVYIKNIIKLEESVPVKCLQVEAKDGMFLCGKTLIPTHNSVLNAALISWSSIFYFRNTSIILNFKKEAALANLAKIKFINDELPEFLKLETTSKSDIKTYINYSNGSKVSVMYPSSVHSKNTIARSLTSPILYIDEAAFISDMSDVFGAAQQVLSKAREQAKKSGYPYFIAISSTPNGIAGDGEWFFDRWENGVDSDLLFKKDSKNPNFEDWTDNSEKIINDPSKNGFIKVRYHWSEDSSKNENWYREQCRELSDKRKVNQELDLIFVGTSNCIFDDDLLSQFKAKEKVDVVDCPHETNLIIYEKDLDRNDFYLIGVDTARSLSGAYNSIEIFSFAKFNQIAEFNYRLGSFTKYGEIINFIFRWLYKQVGRNIILAIENNTIGLKISPIKIL